MKDITPPVLPPKAPPVEIFEKSIHQEVRYTIDQLIELVFDICTYLNLDDITIIRVYKNLLFALISFVNSITYLIVLGKSEILNY